MLQMILVTFNYTPIYTYADILIFMYMYRNNIHKCIYTRPTIMQSYKIDIIIFEVCRYYLLHIIYKGTLDVGFCRSVTPPQIIVN